MPRTPRTVSRTNSPGCRFIADRGTFNLDKAHYALTREARPHSPVAMAGRLAYLDQLPSLGAAAAEPAAAAAAASPNRAMRSLLFGDDVASGPSDSSPNASGLPAPPSPSRVLDFSPARPATSTGAAVWEDSPRTHAELSRAVAAAAALATVPDPDGATVGGPGSGSPAARRRKEALRVVPSAADRILDAPGLRADFYLNILDWSRGNVLAVALDATVYLWAAATATIRELLTVPEGAYVSALRFIDEDGGQYLGVGLSTGAVEIWDTGKLARVRTIVYHTARVACLAWHAHLLASGSRDGHLLVSDVRARDHAKVALRAAHAYEICGLQWSPDGKWLASGGNDNVVNVWTRAGALVRRLDQHTAAVKALAWCPAKPDLLATGGGSQDRCIRIFNVATGAMMAARALFFLSFALG